MVLSVHSGLFKNQVLGIMQGEHQYSEWYQNQGKSVKDIKLKREKAQKAGLMQTPVRANSRYSE